MDSSGSSGPSSTGAGGHAMGSFIKLGFIGVTFFASFHLFGCYFLSWVMGQQFSTVVYVTAASVVTGTLVVFTIAFLVALNIVLTAVTGLSQGAMNLFGGGVGGQSSRSTSSSFSGSGGHRGSGGRSRSHISDLGEVDGDDPGDDHHGMKLD